MVEITNVNNHTQSPFCALQPKSSIRSSRVSHWLLTLPVSVPATNYTGSPMLLGAIYLWRALCLLSQQMFRSTYRRPLVQMRPERGNPPPKKLGNNDSPASDCVIQSPSSLAINSPPSPPSFPQLIHPSSVSSLSILASFSPSTPFFPLIFKRPILLMVAF